MLVRAVFHPFLPNGLCGDPAVWIDLTDHGRSLLLDLGDLRRISNRRLLRVDRAVVTHTHMDHFIGFDHLLRLRLARDQELVVTGPPGFLRRVQGKIDAYSWNLIADYPLRVVASELDGTTIRSVVYTGAGRMRPEPQPERQFGGTLHAERAYTLHADVLDHGIPVLGIAVHETERLSVNKDRLEHMGLVPGPWLSELKSAVRLCAPPERKVEAQTVEGTTRLMSCGTLSRDILFRSAGQKIAYFTDLRHTQENRDKVIALAGGADLMICETAFLHRDEALARERCHLTAHQAGNLAREAGVRRLAPFHISPRYQGREQELLEEAAHAFGGPLVELPAGPVHPESEML